VDIVSEDAIVELLKLYDTDKTHILTVKWNENDTGDRILNLLVGGGSRSLTLNENLTIGDGYNVTITAEDADGSIVLDEQTFEVEGEGTATRLFKLVNGADAARTLTFSQDFKVGDPASNECNLNAASNTDIDTGTETVDSFADSIGSTCFWFCRVQNGSAVRASIVMAAWDATGDTVEYTETSTLSVGDTSGLTLAVDIDSNIVRLRATAETNNGTVRCQRMVI